MSQFKGASNFGQTTRAPVMEYRWTRNQGESEQICHFGTYNFLKDTKAPELMLDYDTISIVPEDGEWYKLTAARSSDEWQHIYEVQGSNLSQSVLINRVMKPQFIAIGIVDGNTPTTYAGIVSRIADEVAKKKSGQQSYAEMRSAVSGIMAAPGVTVPDIGFTLMDHLDRNGDQYLAEQYVFRHTVIAPDRFMGNLDYIFNNTHRVYSESGMRDAEFMGVYAPDFPLPKSTLNNSVSAKWLKQPVTFCTTAGQRRQGVYEYLFADDWSALLYANAT